MVSDCGDQVYVQIRLQTLRPKVLAKMFEFQRLNCAFQVGNLATLKDKSYSACLKSKVKAEPRNLRHKNLAKRMASDCGKDLQRLNCGFPGGNLAATKILVKCTSTSIKSKHTSPHVSWNSIARFKLEFKFLFFFSLSYAQDQLISLPLKNDKIDTPLEDQLQLHFGWYFPSWIGLASVGHSIKWHGQYLWHRKR